nr:MAG TPA: hypothetical protein [Caudoviricetes sp.]
MFFLDETMKKEKEGVRKDVPMSSTLLAGLLRTA